MIPFRLYVWGGIALAFALACGGLYIQSKRVANLKQENAVFEAQVSALEDARKRDNKTADELKAIRADQAKSFKKFDERLRTTNVTREVRYETGVCVERDPATYRGLFNEAVGEDPSPDSLF